MMRRVHPTSMGGADPFGITIRKSGERGARLGDAAEDVWHIDALNVGVK